MHRTATLTNEELANEIALSFRLGANGPRFCTAPYVAGHSCLRIGNHDGEHVTRGRTGRLIGWDAE
jgi:hypothetical protein